MNSGFVAVRRGLLDHLEDGRMSPTEFMVFTILVLRADAGTGSGTINAPTLRSTFLHDMSYDTAKRVLNSLEEKGYIFRSIPFKSKKPYPYWVHRYQCSRGKHEMLYTDISKTVVSKDVSDIRYVKVAPDVPPQESPHVPPQESPHVPLYYNKDNDKNNDNDKTTLVNSMRRLSHDVSHQTVAQDDADVSRKVRQEVVPVESIEAVEAIEAHAVPVESIEARRMTGMKWRSGADAGWRDESTGRPVMFDEVNKRISPLGFRWQSGEFFRDGNSVPWAEAIAVIEGRES